MAFLGKKIVGFDRHKNIWNYPQIFVHIYPELGLAAILVFNNAS